MQARILYSIVRPVYLVFTMKSMTLLIVIMIAQLARSQYRVPTVIIEGDGAMCTTCPAADFENVQDVRQTIQDTLNQLIPSQCGSGLWRRVAFLNMSDLLRDKEPLLHLHLYLH